MRSIRWQLPMSYAAVAVISMLVLGATLVATLRSYYVQREQQFLEGNVTALAQIIVEMLDQNVPLPAVRAQIASYSFLSQVRIQLTDASGQIIGDSGVPDSNNRLSISAVSPAVPGAVPTAASTPPNSITVTNSLSYRSASGGRLAPEDDYDIQSFGSQFQMPVSIPVTGNDDLYTPIIRLDFVRVVEGQTDSTLPVSDGSSNFTYSLPATGTLYGFGLGDAINDVDGRSSQSITRPLYSSSGSFLGILKLSEGPAYGRQIVNRVAQSWLLASITATGVATFAGWLVSRQITVPLLALTQTTRTMAGGDLTARARVQTHNELGVLANTFNQMAARVEQTVAELRRFVADAAHELHTPLTALRTNLEIAADEDDRTITRTYIAHALNQAERLQHMTDGLLDLSRLETDDNATPRSVIHLNTLIQELSELYASSSEQAGLNFLLDLPPHPLYVYGSPAQLRSVVGNLLDNAVKFTPSGETVRLSVSAESEQICIVVADTGIGIPRDELPLVFNRFHRSRNAATYSGNGLGLAIVKRMVERHGGTITATSNPPGTTFTVFLPLCTSGAPVLSVTP